MSIVGRPDQLKQLGVKLELAVIFIVLGLVLDPVEASQDIRRWIRVIRRGV